MDAKFHHFLVTQISGEKKQKQKNLSPSANVFT